MRLGWVQTGSASKASNHLIGWRVLAFRQNCSEICTATHTLLAGISSAVTVVSADISFIVLFNEFSQKGVSNRQDKCIHSSHIYAVHGCLENN